MGYKMKLKHKTENTSKEITREVAMLKNAIYNKGYSISIEKVGEDLHANIMIGEKSKHSVFRNPYDLMLWLSNILIESDEI